jgi:hypothetical protein
MKISIRLIAAAALAVMCVAAPAVAQQPPPERQTEYVPVDSLPQQEQMAAAPLLVGAYSFVLVAFFVYLASVARQLQKVQKEIDRLEVDMKRSGRG